MGRLLRIFLLGALAYALWKWLERELDSDPAGPPIGEAMGPVPQPRAASAPAAEPKPEPESPVAADPTPEEAESPAERELPGEDPAQAEEPTSTSSRNGGGPSKTELYKRATELGIKGRSKMSKAELERAISEAS